MDDLVFARRNEVPCLGHAEQQLKKRTYLMLVVALDTRVVHSCSRHPDDDRFIELVDTSSLDRELPCSLFSVPCLFLDPTMLAIPLKCHTEG